MCQIIIRKNARNVEVDQQKPKLDNKMTTQCNRQSNAWSSKHLFSAGYKAEPEQIIAGVAFLLCAVNKNCLNIVQKKYCKRFRQLCKISAKGQG
jgi:hypothetical protein